MVQNVARLSHGSQCHDAFKEYLAHPRSKENPLFFHQISEAVYLVWWLGFEEESFENSNFLWDWVLSEQVRLVAQLQILLVHVAYN